MRLVLSFDPEWVGPWVSQKTGGAWTPGRGTAIGKVGENGALVAGVLYEDWTRANVVCHIAGDPGWASKEFLAVIYDYPFNQLGVRRITVPICSTNKKSIALVESMGFKLESTLDRATPNGDLLLFRMFKEECKYLKGSYAKSLSRYLGT